ncbi:DDB1-and CUL4-associated factor 4 [Nephila pilipes]|uniref:DDB1-and CUL4-associated factor 4 n=1 Tax=Nephila pilipes TaxID=299642 RepID=A0A8X6PIH2_NEPPI|nr:DDB1-and CUL4-associated factor 4 [Nephila pilipes]
MVEKDAPFEVQTQVIKMKCQKDYQNVARASKDGITYAWLQHGPMVQYLVVGFKTPPVQVGFHSTIATGRWQLIDELGTMIVRIKWTMPSSTFLCPKLCWNDFTDLKMSTSRDIMELPGFSRDSEGRYFRVPSKVISMANTSDDGPEGASNPRKKIRRTYGPFTPKCKNVVDSLKNLQNGCLKDNEFECTVSSLRLKNLQLKQEYSYPCGNEDLNIQFLKGGIKTLYGMWVSDFHGSFCYAFGDFRNSTTPPELEAHKYEITYLPSQIKVADLCEGFSHPLCLLYVGNDWISGTGTARLTWRRHVSDDVTEISRHFYVNSAVWSCASNKFTDQFALGVENGIYVNSPIAHLYVKYIKGQTHSVCFNKMGDLIFAGVNNGKLAVIDTRNRAPVLKYKLQDYSIHDISLLSNENYLICAGVNGYLSKIDLRMQRSVVDYLGEMRSTVKIPISINESHNLLCSTGCDNVTRLWSLGGGTPLKCIRPPVENIDCRSWLMADSSKCTIYLLQSNQVYVYEC